MNALDFYSMQGQQPPSPSGFAPRQGRQMSFDPAAVANQRAQMQMAGGGSPDQLPPELLEAIFAMQGANEDQARAKRQMAMADQLRADAPGMVKSTSPGGGRAGAPNYLGAVASVLAQRRAQQLQDDADVQSRNVAAQMSDARRRYYETSTGTRRAPLGHMGDESE